MIYVDLNACITELGSHDTSPPAVHYTTLMYGSEKSLLTDQLLFKIHFFENWF